MGFSATAGIRSRHARTFHGKDFDTTGFQRDVGNRTEWKDRRGRNEGREKRLEKKEFVEHFYGAGHIFYIFLFHFHLREEAEKVCLKSWDFVLDHGNRMSAQEAPGQFAFFQGMERKKRKGRGGALHFKGWAGIVAIVIVDTLFFGTRAGRRSKGGGYTLLIVLERERRWERDL
jgi:hypothetical protein